ncbi:MAG: hypothetical protein GSR72_07760 [Desulfurococcales archaeon]|nr:hypothetical protein [Desulfurococcales archaeon]
MRLIIEASKSRTGKHASRKLAVVYYKNRKEVITKPTGPRTKQEHTRTVYARGQSFITELEDPDIEYIVYVELIRNLRGHVKGYLYVYDREGRLLYEAVLRKRKIRRVSGNKQYSWLVEDAIKSIGLEGYVRRYNHDTGA